MSTIETDRALGDEGGAVPLARDLRDLMRFWTLETVQPYVDSFTLKDLNLFVPCPGMKADQDYRQWVLSAFGIQPLLNIEQARREIIRPAIAAYQTTIDRIFS